MKKNIILFILVLAIFATAFQVKEKTYTFTLNANEVNALFQVIDASTAPHTQVNALQVILNRQLQGQIDTSKTHKP